MGDIYNQEFSKCPTFARIQSPRRVEKFWVLVRTSSGEIFSHSRSCDSRRDSKLLLGLAQTLASKIDQVNSKISPLQRSIEKNKSLVLSQRIYGISCRELQIIPTNLRCLSRMVDIIQENNIIINTQFAKIFRKHFM